MSSGGEPDPGREVVMEKIVMICEKLWIVLILAAFFISWAKGWLKKGFYLTKDQAEEAELMKKQKEEEEKRARRKIVERARMSGNTTQPSAAAEQEKE